MRESSSSDRRNTSAETRPLLLPRERGHRRTRAASGPCPGFRSASSRCGSRGTRECRLRATGRRTLGAGLAVRRVRLRTSLGPPGAASAGHARPRSELGDCGSGPRAVPNKREGVSGAFEHDPRVVLEQQRSDEPEETCRGGSRATDEMGGFVVADIEGHGGTLQPQRNSRASVCACGLQHGSRCSCGCGSGRRFARRARS